MSNSDRAAHRQTDRDLERRTTEREKFLDKGWRNKHEIIFLKTHDKILHINFVLLSFPSVAKCNKQLLGLM